MYGTIPYATTEYSSEMFVPNISSVIAQKGSYTYTGKNQNIVKGHVLYAITGLYSLTGFLMSYNRVIHIACGYGQLALTGVSTFIGKGFVIICNVGYYTLNGFNTIFNKRIHISLQHGVFVLTGVATTIKKYHYSLLIKPVINLIKSLKPRMKKP